MDLISRSTSANLSACLAGRRVKLLTGGWREGATAPAAGSSARRPPADGRPKAVKRAGAREGADMAPESNVVCQPQWKSITGSARAACPSERRHTAHAGGGAAAGSSKTNTANSASKAGSAQAETTNNNVGGGGGGRRESQRRVINSCARPNELSAQTSDFEMTTNDGGDGKENMAAAARSAPSASFRRRPAPSSSPSQTNTSTRRLVALALGLLLPLLLAGALVDAIRLQPEGKEKFYWSGETFVITCQNSNNIKNVKIRWHGPNNQLISENRSQRIHAESSGPHGTRLVVFNATLNQDEGQYRCSIGTADDQRPKETSVFTLKLLKATNFKHTQPRLALTTGKNAEIDCHVEFDPNVSPGTVSWYRNGQPVDTNGDASIQVVEYNPDRQLSQLLLAPVRREHEGLYTCQATSVTPQLSKLNNFDIQLDINYAPVFDQLEQTIWVDATTNALLGGGGGGGGARHELQQQQQRHEQAGHHGGNVFRNQKQAGRMRQQNRLSHADPQQQHGDDHSLPQQAEGGAAAGGGGGESAAAAAPRIVRVELRCACQANPPASIMWFTNSNYQLAATKGQPAHVVEDPAVEVQGHNTSSVLVVAYNLDSNWPLRNDEYKCSAANSLGGTTKKYTIEQGNPPPAFAIGPHRSYSADSAMFEFTLLGPSGGGPDESPAASGKDIVPPVDAFRIRAELASSPAAAPGRALKVAGGQAGGQMGGLQASEAPQTAASKHADMLRREAEPSVQFAYAPQEPGARGAAGHGRPAAWPARHFNVSLSKLPTGQQRLYLEAHNAVGWSPNSTYLGDFYLVSGATSGASLSAAALALLLAAQALLFLAAAAPSRRNPF